MNNAGYPSSHLLCNSKNSSNFAINRNFTLLQNRWSFFVFNLLKGKPLRSWNTTCPMHNSTLRFLLLEEPEGSLHCVLGCLIPVMNYKRECSPQAPGKQRGSSTLDPLRAVTAAGLEKALQALYCH